MEVLFEMGDSKAYKKLKSQAERKAEWRIEVVDGTVVVDHFGEVHVISKKECKEIYKEAMERYYEILPERIKKGYWGLPYSLARYKWLPKYMYRRFLRAVCEAVGKPYRAWMVDVLTPPKRVKARIVFPKKMEWDVLEERAKELKKKIEWYKGFIDDLEKFFKEVKKGE